MLIDLNSNICIYTYMNTYICSYVKPVLYTYNRHMYIHTLGVFSREPKSATNFNSLVRLYLFTLYI